MNYGVFDAHLDQQLHTYYLGLEEPQEIHDPMLDEWNAIRNRYDGDDAIRTEADILQMEEIARQVIDGYTDLPEDIVDQFREGLDELKAWRLDPNAIPDGIYPSDW